MRINSNSNRKPISRKVRLTESRLRKIISETVKDVLWESTNYEMLKQVKPIIVDLFKNVKFIGPLSPGGPRILDSEIFHQLCNELSKRAHIGLPYAYECVDYVVGQNNIQVADFSEMVV